MSDARDPSPSDHGERDARHPSDRPAPPIVISSGELFAGRQEVLIRHGEETYRLRLTRNGKLILQK